MVGFASSPPFVRRVAWHAHGWGRNLGTPSSLAPFVRRLRRVLRFGVGKAALERKRAAKRRTDQERFASEAWRRDGGLAHRDYGSYEQYVRHQSSKLAGVIDRLREKDTAKFEE